MKPTITIEYCTSWGYVAKAIKLAEDLLKNYTNDIGQLSVIPSSGGIFEVTVNDTLAFSKKETGRFPEVLEIFEAFEKALK